jgi:DUF4097 and DUF4098 domain-containing protein YvlB
VLGVIFLIDNIHPDFSVWRNLVRYWPFVLIGFGVLRLAEVLFDAGQPAPAGPRLPRRGSGGGFGLIVLLCFLFWAADHLQNHVRINGLPVGGLDVFGDTFEYPVSGTGSAAGVNLVVLEGLRGNVSVTGGEGDDYSAEGQKTVRSYNKSDADLADRETQLKFVREDNRLVVRMDGAQVSNGRRVSADIDLKVPKGVSIELHGRSGDVTVSSLLGTVAVATDRGDVRLYDIGGDAKLTVAHSGLVRVVNAKGAVGVEGSGADLHIENVAGEVTVNGSYSGTLEFKNLAQPLHLQSPQTEMRVEKLPGSLTLDLGELRANNIGGPMRLRTKSRDIHIEEFTDSLDLDVTARGDIQISNSKAPTGKIDLHTRNGDISIALPEKAEFDLSATTNQGEAHNDYGPAVKLGLDGRSSTLRSVNGSGEQIVANTNRGSISVAKSSRSHDE